MRFSKEKEEKLARIKSEYSELLTRWNSVPRDLKEEIRSAKGGYISRIGLGLLGLHCTCATRFREQGCEKHRLEKAHDFIRDALPLFKSGNYPATIQGHRPSMAVLAAFCLDMILTGQSCIKLESDVVHEARRMARRDKKQLNLSANRRNRLESGTKYHGLYA